MRCSKSCRCIASTKCSSILIFSPPGTGDRVGDERHPFGVPRRIGLDLVGQGRPDGEDALVDEDDAAVLPVRLEPAEHVDQHRVVGREEAGGEDDRKLEARRRISAGARRRDGDADARPRARRLIRSRVQAYLGAFSSLRERRSFDRLFPDVADGSANETTGINRPREKSGGARCDMSFRFLRLADDPRRCGAVQRPGRAALDDLLRRAGGLVRPRGIPTRTSSRTAPAGPACGLARRWRRADDLAYWPPVAGFWHEQVWRMGKTDAQAAAIAEQAREGMGLMIATAVLIVVVGWAFSRRAAALPQAG